MTGRVAFVVVALAALGAGCALSHEVGERADAGPVECSADIGVDLGPLSLDDCDPREFGGAFHYIDLCIPVQVNVADIAEVAGYWHGTGSMRCEWVVAFNFLASSTTHEGRGALITFEERRCPQLAPVCRECSFLPVVFERRPLFRSADPSEVVRGEYRIAIRGYRGEALLRVTREPTLPDEQCVRFLPE